MTAELVETGVPDWLRRVAVHPPADPHGTNQILRNRAKPGQPRREAAVLILFGGPIEANPRGRGGLPADADVLLTQRSMQLRQHPGQVAFPGGKSDPTDRGPIHTALREAEEETGLDPSGVDPISVLPAIFVPPSKFTVTPVIGYWRTPSPVGVVDKAEANRVIRVPVAELLDPANRFQTRHPLGFEAPAFSASGMIVWGFTAGLLAGLFAVSDWEEPWDHRDVRDLEKTLEDAGMADSLRPWQPDTPSLRELSR